MSKLKECKNTIMTGVGILTTQGYNAWGKFMRDEVAQAQGTIMAIVTGSITLMIGLIIFVNVKTSMPAVADSAANTTMNATSAIVYSSLGLVAIGFIVLAAVFILAVVGQLRSAGE